MKKLLPTLLVLAVASVTGGALAQQAPAPAAAKAAAPAATAGATPAAAGNAQAGEKKIAMCIGCHGIAGYQASFPEVYRVPMISGQSAKFIATALNAYKKGERRHPSMRGIADSLSDQDILDISAYYEQHGSGKKAPDTPARQPTAQVGELLKKGACVSCHGTNFSKPIDVYPKLAGQHADYLFVALKSYKVEGGATWGRANGVMGGIVKQFTNAELKAMADYISTLDGEMSTVPQKRFR